MSRVKIFGERKRVVTVEPAVIGVATVLSVTDFDHDRLKELKDFFDYNSKDDVFIEEGDLGEYAEEYLRDTGTEIPSWISVDWEETGRTLSMDMDSTEWEGSTWYRI